MKKVMHKIYSRHRDFWSGNNVWLLSTGVFIFVISLLVQNIADHYVDYYVDSTPVGDILLNNLPIINLDFFIVQGALILTVLVILLLVVKPEYLPFTMKTMAL